MFCHTKNIYHLFRLKFDILQGDSFLSIPKNFSSNLDFLVYSWNRRYVYTYMQFQFKNLIVYLREYLQNLMLYVELHNLLTHIFELQQMLPYGIFIRILMLEICFRAQTDFVTQRKNRSSAALVCRIWKS